MTDIHVMPIKDLRVHFERDDCHCNPRIEYEGDDRIIIHNSYDHREICEWENEEAQDE